jgi:dienelactone hydrolase
MRWALASILVLAAGAGHAQQRETITFESRQKDRPVRVTAEIYWPAKTGPVPALVLHHAAGGISREREGRYAQEMTAMGVAAVVIDSFPPRGVTSTVQDASAVPSVDFNLDALGALKALGADPRIDRTRIGIAGFSMGGTSALMASHESLLASARVPAGLRYALHVPFYPGCARHYYRPRTSGAPIYMLLGGDDTFSGVEPCQIYASAIRAEGGRIEVKVFANAQHSFDDARPYFDRMGENYSQCIFQQQADRSWIERKSGITISASGGNRIDGAMNKALAVCRTLGVSGGPNEAAKKQSMEDLKGYVRRHLQDR